MGLFEPDDEPETKSSRRKRLGVRILERDKGRSEIIKRALQNTQTGDNEQFHCVEIKEQEDKKDGELIEPKIDYVNDPE